MLFIFLIYIVLTNTTFSSSLDFLLWRFSFSSFLDFMEERSSSILHHDCILIVILLVINFSQRHQLKLSFFSIQENTPVSPPVLVAPYTYSIPFASTPTWYKPVPILNRCCWGWSFWSIPHSHCRSCHDVSWRNILQ